MPFNPLQEKGMPLDRQLRNWSELNSKPYDPEAVDPYTRCRVITMNGIEIEANFFGHNFARHTADDELRRHLAETRRVEAQQQKAINWLTPGEETTLEVTLGYEQVAVDLTSWLARAEPDPYIRQVLEFGLLEDFDHLYRYANLYEMLEGKKAEKVVDQLTEVMPGRPTREEHRHPHDDLRAHMDGLHADPLSRLHAITITAAEQQTMNFYNTIGNRPMEPLARGLYLEIGMIEEQHVTQYESLMDPTETWLQQLVAHEYNECYLYHSFAEQETDGRIRGLWERHLEMELGQLQVACDLLRKHDQVDPESFLPDQCPDIVRFEPNKEYIRQVLADQIDFQADGFEISTAAPERYHEYQAAVNGDGPNPTEQVITDHVQQFGEEYRLQTEGEHPVERLRG